MTDSSPAPVLSARLKRFIRPAKWGVGVLLAIAILGFGVVPPVARHYGVKILSEELGRTVSIERVGFNPFTLTAEVHDAKVMEADGQQEAFGFDLLRANLELESLIRGGPVLSELSLAGPRFHLVHEGEGRYNWSDVIDRFAAEPASDKPMNFSIGNIQITGGHAVVDDKPKGRRHEIDELTLGVPFISNLPVKVDVFVEPSLSARINGDPLQLTGRSKPFGETRETVFDVVLKDFELAPWLAYLPFEPSFRLPSGRLGANLEVGFAQPEGKPSTVTLKGQIQIDELAVQDKNGQPALSVGELGVELADVQPLTNKWHFSRLRLIKPEVELTRLADGGINLLGLLPKTNGNTKAKPATKTKPAPGAKPAPGKNGEQRKADEPPPVDFLLAQARIREGVVHYRDQSLAQPFEAQIDAITLDLRDLANIGDMPAEIRLDYVIDGGGKFSHQDQVRIAPQVDVAGTVTVEQLRPGRFAPYFAAALPGGELRDGKVDGSLRYHVALDKASGEDAPQVELMAENLALSDFAVALAGAKDAAIRVPAATVREVEVKLKERTVSVAEIGVNGAAVSTVRSRDGRFDLESLLGPSSDDAGAAPWSVNVARLVLADASARVEDRKAEKPVVLAAEKIALQVENLSTDKGAVAQVALNSHINNRGKLDVKGTLGLEPFKLGMEVDLENVDLLPLQSYVLERTKIAISRGSLTTKGTLELEQAKAHEGDGENAFHGRFRGNVGVVDFASVDRLNSTDFVRWRTLDLNGVDVQLAPFALDIDGVTLADFHTRMILNEEGRLNLREIRADDEVAMAPAPDQASAPSVPAGTLPAPADSPPPIRIGTIRFKNGNIAFSDRFVRPHYDANLTGMNGSLSGLSSDQATVAKLDLQGKVANAAPVSVKGEFNPFRQDRYLDIVMAVRDFELTDLSSYSGKYVGYGIQKGKLSADLNYKIENRKLTATNRIFLDQLTFGDKTESPDALDLPVQFAVSLLKNGRGEINLNLPISGTLDDPQFSISGLVVQAFINLIGKAVSAPFALLGAMFEGGEAMSFLDFAPGTERIDEAQAEKLDNLAKALKDRPALRLDIAGHADPDSDIDGLKRAHLDEQIRAAKAKAEAEDKEDAAASSDEDGAAKAEISEAEYAELLEQVYDDADFKKPRNFIGLAKSLPVPEMEALILANTKVDDGALRALAQRRAQVARQWLLENGQVSAEQVFLLAPEVGPGPEGDGRRVHFSLR